MVVTCPSCQSRYAVDPKAIGPAGRTVQCVRCDHQWFQRVEGPQPVPDIVIRPQTAGASVPAVIPPEPPFSSVWMAIFIAFVILLAAAVAIISYEAHAFTPTESPPLPGSFIAN